MFSVEAIPAFADNYIWMLLSEDGKTAALVDPGDAGPVLAVLQERRIQPCALLITHHHYDHTGGVHQLVTAYNMPVYAPAEENIRGTTHPVKQGDQVELEKLGARFEVLDVPGHTNGHVAYHGHDMLFCGDTLFTGGCGRLFEGTATQMHASLQKIAALPDETLVYCAHEYTQANLTFAKLVEPDNARLLERIETVRALRAQDQATVPASLELEKHTNPFLRYDVPEVVAAAGRFRGRDLTAGAEVFGVLREWKDKIS